MTRIISGAAGSLSLEVPAHDTRPTSDRVRESVFGALEARGVLDGARVLDLYAGSGALGLEALSRGAAHVDLVEKAPRAAAVIEGNARRVQRAVGTASCRVHRMSADAYLAASPVPFDLVFLDPPYDLGEEELTATLALLVPALTASALVLVERARRSPQPTLPVELTLDRHRAYGDTAVWWLALEDQPSDASQSR